ncbi:MAG: hypothetical protein LBQ10_00060, partial [Desulfovibrio sp.]|nr:hypothetical protein [Desulfovibrio sp.]
MFGKKDAAGADIFTLEGDRSPESLTQGTRLSKKLTTIFMIVCAVILGLFLGWRYLSHVAEKRRLAEEEATKADTTKKVEQSLPALTVPPPPALPAPPSAPVTVTSPQTGTQSGPK